MVGERKNYIIGMMAGLMGLEKRSNIIYHQARDEGQETNPVMPHVQSMETSCRPSNMKNQRLF